MSQASSTSDSKSSAEHVAANPEPSEDVDNVGVKHIRSPPVVGTAQHVPLKETLEPEVVVPEAETDTSVRSSVPVATGVTAEQVRLIVQQVVKPLSSQLDAVVRRIDVLSRDGLTTAKFVSETGKDRQVMCDMQAEMKRIGKTVAASTAMCETLTSLVEECVPPEQDATYTRSREAYVPRREGKVPHKSVERSYHREPEDKAREARRKERTSGRDREKRRESKHGTSKDSEASGFLDSLRLL